MRIPLTPLGQSGFRFQFDGCVVYVDPYLSNSVEKTEGEALRRMVPIRIDPARITDASYVFITHVHLDHCDPETIVPISLASPRCRFICPAEVASRLKNFGVAGDRIVVAREEWMTLDGGLRVRPAPASHPAIERDQEGNPRCLGYVMECAGRRIYHAGDTSVCREMLDTLAGVGPIEVAMLPVNECNYYRHTAGIIGNMTVREAFRLATDIGAKVLVPMHWDMFEVNSVFPEEIELLYKLIRPNVELVLNPTEI